MDSSIRIIWIKKMIMAIGAIINNQFDPDETVRPNIYSLATIIIMEDINPSIIP